ncbi:AGAP012039-PA, partial [Anopheles gambiae str. PEST]
RTERRVSRFYQYANNFPFPAKTRKFNPVVPFKRKPTPDKCAFPARPLLQRSVPSSPVGIENLGFNWQQK